MATRVTAIDSSGNLHPTTPNGACLLNDAVASVYTIYTDAVTGNDTTGTGAIGAPYATPQRAVQDVDVNNSRYYIRCSGAYTFSSQWTLPNLRSVVQSDSNTATVGVAFTKAQRAAVTFYAEPVLLETVTSSDITSTATDATTLMVTYTCSGKSWTVNAYKGKYIISATGTISMVASNTATTITLCSIASNATADFTINDYGASFTATNTTSTLLFSGAMAPYGFIGIDIENGSTGVAALIIDTGLVSFQGCKLDGVTTRNLLSSNSSATRGNYFLGCYLTTQLLMSNIHVNINNCYIDAPPSSSGQVRMSNCVMSASNFSIGSTANSSLIAWAGCNITTPTSISGQTIFTINSTKYFGRMDGGSQISPATLNLTANFSSSVFDSNGTDTCFRAFCSGFIILNTVVFNNATGAGLNLGGGSLGIQLSAVSGTCSTVGLVMRDGVRGKCTTGGTNNTLTGTTADIQVGNAGLFQRTWTDFYANPPVGVVWDPADGSLLCKDGQGSPFFSPLRDNEGQVGETARRWKKSYFYTLAATTSISLDVAGGGFLIKEGSNCTMGLALLDGSTGTVVVSTNKVTANSRIMLTPQDGTLNIGSVWVGARSAGSTFTISSSNVLDARNVAWQIIEPA